MGDMRNIRLKNRFLLVYFKIIHLQLLLIMLLSILFQYVLIPLQVKYAPAGTWISINIKDSISTPELIEFNNIRTFANGFNRSRAPRIPGSIIESKTKGASVIRIYLDFDIASSE